MIDWWNLALNSCWIIGCALWLANFSYWRWIKQFVVATTSTKTEPIINVIAFLLIGFGATLLATPWWQTLFLATAFCVLIVLEVWPLVTSSKAKDSGVHS